MPADSTSAVTAICDAIAPDKTYGALALGADIYVLDRLSRDADMAARVRRGIDAFVAAAPETLPADGSAPKNASFVESLQQVEHEDWFATLVALVEEGLYADPGNGGNRDALSWQRLGYRHGLPEGPNGPDRSALPRKTPPPGDETEFDAIVVGSGAGGGVMAACLARGGKTVALIERGAWHSYKSAGFRDHLRNHRLSTYGINTGPDAEGNPRIHVAPDATERTVHPHEFDYHNNAACVGSGTMVYGGLAWRFHPDDFRMASRYGVPDGSSLTDWPIGYDELEPWYARAEDELGVAGDGQGDPNAGPRRAGYPLPPVQPNAGTAVLRQGAERMGLNVFAPPLLVNTVPRDGRAACIGCGSCVGFPCPVDAKNGVQNTLLPKALATRNLHLFADTRARRILADANGRVTGVELEWRGNDGAPARAKLHAKRVVVAAGAIETARLLLLSPTLREPNGLGNNADLVGRNLQGHFYATAFGIFDKKVHADRGPGVTIATTDHVHGNPGIIGGGILADDFVMPPVVFRKTAWPPQRRRWGVEAEAFMHRAYPRVTQIRAPVHEIPDPTCRITLDLALRDDSGLPVARLSGQVHGETMRTADYLFGRATDWLNASGAQETWGGAPPRRLSAYQHQAGTCRMGTDPETSVTDAFGRVWGHDNLFVSDASLHPTNGGYNPVLTIMALAFRNADHLLKTWN